MKTLKKAIELLTPYERKRGLLVLILVMGMALLETAGIASIMPFLAVLGNPQMVDTNPILSAVYVQAQTLGVQTADDFLVLLGIGSFVFIIISAVYRTLTHYVMNRYIEMRRHSIGKRLLKVYLHQTYDFFLGCHSDELSKNILSEVDQLISHVFRPVINLAANSLMLVTITVLLLVVNPVLALLAAGLTSGLYVLVFIGLKGRLKRLGSDRMDANTARFMATSEAFDGIKNIKLLGCEQSYISRFQASSQQYAATQASHQTFKEVPNFLIEAIMLGGILLVTLMLMITDTRGNSALGGILPILGLYAFAAYRIKPAMHGIYKGFASLRFGQAAVDNLYADLCQLNVHMPFSCQGSIPIKLSGVIALENLSYSYPEAGNSALDNLNLKIPVGSTVGIVGSTGAGKTTLVDVILGLLRPTKGAITIDGIPVSDENLCAWQNNLGYVPQDIFLTDSSISENIAFGISSKHIDHEQVIRCARMAHVHDFIVQELPNKYATLVGERGVRLSGGQRQRIGIARALYNNPDVLVFDEATSALDTVTELAVMSAIDSLVHNKTIILIAHRLSTVKSCDQIVLLEHGEIKTVGRFEMLLQENKQFRSMAGVVN